MTRQIMIYSHCHPGTLARGHPCIHCQNKSRWPLAAPTSKCMKNVAANDNKFHKVLSCKCTNNFKCSNTAQNMVMLYYVFHFFKKVLKNIVKKSKTCKFHTSCSKPNLKNSLCCVLFNNLRTNQSSKIPDLCFNHC